jgi:uroporphyrinogen decarboxylase
MPDIGLYGENYEIDEFDIAVWHDFWGTESIQDIDFWPCHMGGKGFKTETYIKDGFEFVESESGALTRQVIDNDDTYSMPEYIRFDIRDQKSYEVYKERNTPSQPWTKEELDEACKKYDKRTEPLWISVGGTWGIMRYAMGPEFASTVLYDDPELVHDYMQWQLQITRDFMFPLIERLKPDVVAMHEDFCYNKGMFISPRSFNEFCAQTYSEIGECVKKAGVPVFVLDCDGHVEEAVDLLVPLGINALFPFEVKANNNLYRVREKHQEFIIFGGLEKECINAGNSHMIKQEIESKIDLINGGRYFPNGDHGIQPLADYTNLCKFMTLLHEVTENPLGSFPKIKP